MSEVIVPKFKVGDILYDNENGSRRIVEAVSSNEYMISYPDLTCGTINNLSFSYLENICYIRLKNNKLNRKLYPDYIKIGGFLVKEEK